MKQKPRFERISISLSGGGFRATLFHLGVLGYLKKAGVLHLVKRVCGVSGGSIVAGHLVSFWDQYNASNESFATQIKKLASWVGQIDISGKAINEVKVFDLAKMKLLNTQTIEMSYSELLDSDSLKRTWAYLDSKKGDVPELNILATLLSTGQAVAFTPAGCEAFSNLDDWPRKKEVDKFVSLLSDKDVQQKLRQKCISWAMSASSAFPPLFLPVPLEAPGIRFQLTDGGVFDNSGIRWLRHKHESQESSERELVISSDAARLFPFDVESEFDSFVELTSRIYDTQAYHHAVNDLEEATRFYEAANNTFSFAHVPIYQEWENCSTHTWETQNLVKQIRTELDAFDEVEVLSLYRHGYLVASKVISPLLGLAPQQDVRTIEFCPIEYIPTVEQIERGLANSQKVKNFGVIKRRLGKWLLFIPALVFVAGLISGIVISLVLGFVV